jgi:alpha-galactosidase
LRILGSVLTTLVFLSSISLAHDVPHLEADSITGIWIEQPRSPPGHIGSMIEFMKNKSAISGYWKMVGSPALGYKLPNLRLVGDSFFFGDDVGFRGRLVSSGEITFEHDPVEDPASHFRFRRASESDIAFVTRQISKLYAGRLPLPRVHDVGRNGLAETPPMGWNSWNYFQTTIDDKSIREMADAMVNSGLRDVGYVYIAIDDGWQGDRDEKGNLHSNSKFPNMRELADYVHSKGLKFGLYSSPGPLTCGGYVGSYGYEVQDANLFARWGVDYLKYDACSAGNLYTKQTDIRRLFQKMGDALQATRQPIVYSVNGVSPSWGNKVGANSWRTSDDIADTWHSMARNGFQNHGDLRNVGPGAWNDPDMLEVGNGGMTLEEYRTHFTLWTVLAAPLLLGNDLRVMTPETRDLLTNREVIAVNQDRLGKPGQRVRRSNNVEIWSKPLSNGKTAVAVFNRGERPAKINFRWTDLGLSGSREVRDLWARADLQDQGEFFTAVVLPHGSVLLSVDRHR